MDGRMHDCSNRADEVDASIALKMDGRKSPQFRDESALAQPVVFEAEYAAKVPVPTNEQERAIQAEVRRLQDTYGRYVAYGLRLQVPASTRRILLFVASVLGGLETKLSVVGLQRIERSLKLFKAKVCKLQEDITRSMVADYGANSVSLKRACESSDSIVQSPASTMQTPNLEQEERSPCEALNSIQSPPKRMKFDQQDISIITDAPALDISSSTLSPATQRVLTLPGVSPSSVMTGRKVVMEKNDTFIDTDADVDAVIEPIQFVVSYDP